MNKEKIWGWIVAFLVGYMTSSTAGKFISENADNVETKLLLIAFGVAIMIITAVCILRLPSFILGEKIKELL